LHDTTWSVGATVAALILHSGAAASVVYDTVEREASSLRRAADACVGDDARLLRLGLGTHTVRPRDRRSMPAYETAGSCRRAGVLATTVLSPLLLLLVRLRLMSPEMRARAGDWDWLVLHVYYAMHVLQEEPLEADQARAANDAERRAMARGVASWSAAWRGAVARGEPLPRGEERLRRDTEAIVRGYFPANVGAKS
jgi:hypothetical protein